MEQQLLKLLLNRTFYLENRERIVPTMFPGELRTLYDTVVKAHESYERDLTIDEVRALHRTQHPTLTRAQRNNLEELLTDIGELKLVGVDVAKDVLSHMWRQETFREIADIAVNGIEGKVPDLETIRRIIEGRSNSFMPADDYKIVPADLDDLLSEIDSRPAWLFNNASLGENISGMSGGEFLIEFARPESGKTAFHVSIACAPGGWIWQGANVHVIVNEEPGRRTKLRAICAATQMTKEQIRANKDAAKAIWAQVKDRYTIVDCVEMTMGRLDAYCRKHKPDILIVDQLDKVGVGGSYGATHEKLREIYLQAREIAKRHNLLMVGVCQASADAENKPFITYAMMEGSKTGKAAEADVIIGIGRYPQNEAEDDEDFTRILNVSKNKISSWHGHVAVTLDPFVSTFKD